MSPYELLALITQNQLPYSKHVALAALVLVCAMSLFFALYVCAVSLYQQHLNKTLPVAGYVLGAPWLVLMLLVDVAFQYTLVSALYREWPPRGEWTVTRRLSRWKRTDPASLRGRWSMNLCKLLNLFTPPSAPHC